MPGYVGGSDVGADSRVATTQRKDNSAQISMSRNSGRFMRAIPDRWQRVRRLFGSGKASALQLSQKEYVNFVRLRTIPSAAFRAWHAAYGNAQEHG